MLYVDSTCTFSCSGLSLLDVCDLCSVVSQNSYANMTHPGYKGTTKQTEPQSELHTVDNMGIKTIQSMMPNIFV